MCAWKYKINLCITGYIKICCMMNDKKKKPYVYK